jgi:hypothetical protein
MNFQVAAGVPLYPRAPSVSHRLERPISLAFGNRFDKIKVMPISFASACRALAIGVVLISVDASMAGEPTTGPASTQQSGSTSRPSRSKMPRLSLEERERLAKEVFMGWCLQLMSEGLGPPADLPLELHGVDGKEYPVDVVRGQYKLADKTITVTQTKCVFCIKFENIDLKREGVTELDVVTALARQYFNNPGEIKFEWTDQAASPRVGRATPMQITLSQFLQHLAFTVDGSTVRIYGLKHVDGPSQLVLGFGRSLNSWWFTTYDRSAPKPRDPKDKDFSTEVMSAVLR